MLKCRRGVTWKPSTSHYLLNSMEETHNLYKGLFNDTYVPRKALKFKIQAPKEKIILSISFRDRVFQRSLNDNALYPQMTKSFIYDNWACQKGKGTDFAHKRVVKLLRKMYINHGTDFYILKMDVKGYYNNMQHELVNDLFRKKIKNETICKMALKVLSEQYSGDIGYNPGSQMVQIAGIAFLDNLDHYIKEQIRPHGYGRYMDDSIIASTSKELLQEIVKTINGLLGEIGLTLHKKKTKIYKATEGFDFLGFKFRVTDTGKVLQTVKAENVKAKRKTLRNMVKKSKRGELPKTTVDRSYEDWKRHVKKGNAYYKLLKRMDKYYKDLWKGVA